MPRYEAHITCDLKDAKAVEDLASAYSMDWVYSQIAGCPILGKGTYCYLTGYSPDQEQLHSRVQATASLLRRGGVEPLRLKIERIVFDTKTGVNELET